MVKRTALVVTSALAMGSLPVIATSPDCSKWLAQYRAALQRARARHALRHIKHDLVAHRHTRRLSPLAALRKFQVDCGPDVPVALPVSVPIFAPVPVSVPVAVTPEPAAWMLVATGFGVLMFMKRRLA